MGPHSISRGHNQTSISAHASSSNEAYKPKDVKTTFRYYRDLPGGGSPEPHYSQDHGRNLRREASCRELTVHDIRGYENEFTFDTAGFEFHKHVSAEKEFLDQSRVKAIYYPEIEMFVKALTGATQVRAFHNIVRRPKLTSQTSPQSTTDTHSHEAAAHLVGPLHSVHNDQSYEGSPDLVRHHFPEEAENLLKGRVQIINIWRPIKTILKDPFAVVAAKSVHDNELVPIRILYPTHEGAYTSVRPAKQDRTDGGHQWYYWFKQTPEEVTLFKCFDSKTDGRARCVPHSAFVDDDFENEAPRESVEVRVFVFHEDDVT